MILMKRGVPVAEPIDDATPDEQDPFYSITDLAEKGKCTSNKQMDEILYGS